MVMYRFFIYKKNNIIPAAAVFLLVWGYLFILNFACVAGEYLDSAHGQNVDRDVMSTAGYAVGNCAHCHEQHDSVEGATDTANIYLGFGHEENLCFGCHGNGGAGVAPKNIETDVVKASGHGFIEDNLSVLHKVQESQGDIATGGKHVECTDCHNPHKAGATVHTPAADTVATNLTAASPLYGAKGVVPTFSGSNWTTPSSYSSLQPATKEYQICFKCHSGALGQDPAIWSETSGLGSEAWTDVGLEFSPGNRSGHPIVTGLNNYPNSFVINDTFDYTTDIKGLGFYQLLPPWRDNRGEQTMYCSDCHASDSTAAGPHGSTYKWMLAGDNKAWPYQTAANNGTSSSNYYTLEEMQGPNNNQQDWVPTTYGSPDGCFCWNCHPYIVRPSTGRWSSNNVHPNGNHTTAECVECHIRVPHGGQVSRLMAADLNGAMPARYNPDGTSSTSSRLQKFTKDTNHALDYKVENCATAIGPGACAKHSAALGGGEEYWQ